MSLVKVYMQTEFLFRDGSAHTHRFVTVLISPIHLCLVNLKKDILGISNECLGFGHHNLFINGNSRSVF